jgi:hypothetical protein
MRPIHRALSGIPGCLTFRRLKRLAGGELAEGMIGWEARQRIESWNSDTISYPQTSSV